MIKQLKSQFNADGLEVTQSEATSKDGTKIPYFVINKKGMVRDGRNPTLLYGYGGFEISLLPVYSAVTGVGWLEGGGVWVRANIRGGGEFGPAWHQAALKENRNKAYEDFIAVAEQLIADKTTSRQHLACQGGSNGGLLVGNMLTMRPDLWGAVVCKVPLLDMKRYNKLLAGASWVGEYGDPDVAEQWAYLKQYSAYQNIDTACAKDTYPPTLFTTSTRDDRVHPGAFTLLGRSHLVCGRLGLFGGCICVWPFCLALAAINTDARPSTAPGLTSHAYAIIGCFGCCCDTSPKHHTHRTCSTRAKDGGKARPGRLRPGSLLREH